MLEPIEELEPILEFEPILEVEQKQIKEQIIEPVDKAEEIVEEKTSFEFKMGDLVSLVNNAEEGINENNAKIPETKEEIKEKIKVEDSVQMTTTILTISSSTLSNQTETFAVYVAELFLQETMTRMKAQSQNAMTSTTTQRAVHSLLLTTSRTLLTKTVSSMYLSTEARAFLKFSLRCLRLLSNI